MWERIEFLYNTNGHSTFTEAFSLVPSGKQHVRHCGWRCAAIDGDAGACQLRVCGRAPHVRHGEALCESCHGDDESDIDDNRDHHHEERESEGDADRKGAFIRERSFLSFGGSSLHNGATQLFRRGGGASLGVVEVMLERSTCAAAAAMGRILTCRSQNIREPR